MRKGPMATSLIAVSLCLLTGIGCSIPAFTFKARQQREFTAAHVPGAAIAVSTRNGSVQISRDSSLEDVRVVANVGAGGATQAEADARLAQVVISVEHRSESVLDISVEFPGGWRNGDGCSFEILIPDATGGVIVDTSNGSIRIESLGGPADLQTSNGRVVVVDQDGPVDIGTSNGAITVRGASGPVDARTSNGSVIVADAGGTVRIRTSNGRITLEAGQKLNDLFDLRTSNGSIQVTLPASLTGSVRASTSNARVNIQAAPAGAEISGSKRNRKIEFAQDGPASTIQTSNGTITITFN